MIDPLVALFVAQGDRRDAEEIEAMLVSPPEPVAETPNLKVHQPEPPKKVHAVFDDIEFDDDLIAKMMANMASNGMSAADIFG